MLRSFWGFVLVAVYRITMALMDDTSFLVSHIRNSFITSDDTGVCEMVIEPDETDKKLPETRPHSWHVNGVDNGADSTDSELSHSPDIVSDMDYSGHRRRSNTAQRLERLKKEKQNKSKIKHIVWKEPPADTTDASQLFSKKDLPPTGEKKTFVSALSQQIELCASMPNNPYSDYAKFDGKVQTGVPTKKIDIFLTMVSERDRPFPMTVIVIVTAKVQELIGLICWQYSTENRKPKLNDELTLYSLHMVEDDGEVDMDFPALDNKEPISKFGFFKLALVQKKTRPKKLKTSVVVTVNFPHNGFSKIQIESSNVLLKDVIEKALHKRKVKKKGLQYIIEKQNEPGIPLDPAMSLNAADCLEFCLVRENSARETLEELFPGELSSMADSLSSHQYKSYRVSLLCKFRQNIDVHLAVSGEKIEIDPVSQKSTVKFFTRTPKAMTFDSKSVATCDIIEEKSTGRSSLRIVYLYSTGHDYRHYDIEADTETSKEIVQKIQNIMEMRSSPVRKEYLALKEKKLHRRFSSIT